VYIDQAPGITVYKLISKDSHETSQYNEVSAPGVNLPTQLLVEGFSVRKLLMLNQCGRYVGALSPL